MFKSFSNSEPLNSIFVATVLTLQGWSEIIEKNVKNGVVLEATSN